MVEAVCGGGTIVDIEIDVARRDRGRTQQGVAVVGVGSMSWLLDTATRR